MSLISHILVQIQCTKEYQNLSTFERSSMQKIKSVQEDDFNEKLTAVEMLLEAHVQFQAKNIFYFK